MPKRTSEPIAIIGMACRFPGANDIESFWRLLESGRNAVTEGVPGSGEGRWGLIFGDDAVESEGCRFGAFVDDIELFDDTFFNPDRLRESRTGIYTGISNDEYRMLVVESDKPAEAASCLYALSGTNLNGQAFSTPASTPWLRGVSHSPGSLP